MTVSQAGSVVQQAAGSLQVAEQMVLEPRRHPQGRRPRWAVQQPQEPAPGEPRGQPQGPRPQWLVHQPQEPRSALQELGCGE